MKQSITPKARKDSIVVQQSNNETLVYDLTINKAYLLNETSAFIWHLCDGYHNVDEIRRQVAQKFRQSVNEDFIWLAIEQLSKDNLMANADELPDHFQGMKRREVISKIGLATMLALPMISNIIAPTAAQASSGGCVTTGCTHDNYTQADCCGSTNRCFGNSSGPGFGNCGSCYPSGDFTTFFNVPGRCANPTFTFNIQNACCSGSHFEVDLGGGLYECRCT